MTQTVCTHTILAGRKMIILEKPHILRRIFFSLRVLAGQTMWYDLKMSFDDPAFHSFYAINGPEKYFEASGVDIFQGNVWLHNNSDTDLPVSATQILH